MSAQIVRFPSFAKVLRLFGPSHEIRRLDQVKASEESQPSRCEVFEAERLIAANRTRIECLRMKSGQVGGIF